MSSFAELHARLQKPAPAVIDRKARKRADESEYQRNAKIVRERDKHCRVCGTERRLSTHHVISRSRARRSKEKHAVERMMTLCYGTATSCHQQLHDGLVKIYPNTERDTNGPCTVEKWDKASKQWQVAMRKT